MRPKLSSEEAKQQGNRLHQATTRTLAARKRDKRPPSRAEGRFILAEEPQNHPSVATLRRAARTIPVRERVRAAQMQHELRTEGGSHPSGALDKVKESKDKTEKEAWKDIIPPSPESAADEEVEPPKPSLQRRGFEALVGNALADFIGGYQPLEGEGLLYAGSFVF